MIVCENCCGTNIGEFKGFYFDPNTGIQRPGALSDADIDKNFCFTCNRVVDFTTDEECGKSKSNTLIQPSPGKTLSGMDMFNRLKNNKLQ